MSKDIERIKRILNESNPYSIEAYQFVLRCLRTVTHGTDQPRHVSGQELLGVIKDFGTRQFGFLVPEVFEFWGIRETLDFGRIVFDLVDMGILRKAPNDSLDDFKENWHRTSVPGI